MPDFRQTDNSGHAAPAACFMAETVAGTAQVLTNGTALADATVTVVGGKTYLVVPVAGTGGALGDVLMGILTVATAANVRWVAPCRVPTAIRIPEGTTTLHYAVTVVNTKAYLIELA